MKCSNIKYSAVAILDNKIIAHRFFCSEQAKNNWCNRQYDYRNPRCEEITVKVYHFSTDALLETWHA